MADVNHKALFSDNRSAFLFIAVGIAAIIGILVATQVQLENRNSTGETEIKNLIISGIVLGVPTSAEQAKLPNPRLEQKNTYATTDLLAMRITSTADATEAFSVNVRLLKPDGSILALEPPSASFTPGTSTFCCWRITKVGTYTMQIFRPEGIVSTIPLLIEQPIDTSGQSSSFNLFQ